VAVLGAATPLGLWLGRARVERGRGCEAGPRRSAVPGRGGAWAAGDTSAGGVLRAGRALLLGR